MHSIPHPKSGATPRTFALLGLFGLLTLPLPATLSDLDSVWLLDLNVNEANGGTALLPTGFIPAYTTDQIGGVDATVLDLPALPATHWLQFGNGTGANGGGTRTNNWTLVMDVKFSSFDGDIALLQTAPLNDDDAEAHVAGGSGVTYEYFEFPDPISVLPDFDALTPVSSGTTLTMDLSTGHRLDRFGFRYRGRIQIDSPGDYTFYTTSDDGSQLFIDGNLVVDNDGLHSAAEESGSITLSAGNHDIEVTFFENTGDAVLAAEYEGPGVPRQVIPGAVLTHGSAGTLRLGADLVSDPGTVLKNRWYRLVLTGEVSGPNLLCKAYLDGVPTSIGGLPVTATKTVDGDFSFDTVVNLFADDTLETQPVLVNSLAYWGTTLSGAEVAALGVAHPKGVPVLYVSSSGGGGPGTLREAVTNVPSGGIISFDLAMDGASTDLSASGALNITGKSLCIDAAHLPLGFTLDGSSNTRLMSVGSGIEVGLKGLTLTRGQGVSDGGAMFNNGTLTIDRCIFTDNSSQALGGAIANNPGGILNVADSTFNLNSANAGGAILNAGTATVRRSTLVQNTAAAGGAIENDDTMTIINSTIVGNTATAGAGGGCFTLGALTVISSTIMENDTCGGFDGGGGISIEFFASATIDNSIVTLNTNCDSFEDNIGGFGGTTFLGNNITFGDPMLSPLGNFGGPTLTRLPVAGSPAAGGGSTTVNTPATDQRGEPRIVGTLDIGATETASTSGVSGYPIWANANINGGQDSTFTGDSEGDGAANGLEYAHRLNPQLVDTHLQPVAVPVPDGGGGEDLQIVIPYRATATDLIYILEQTNDLVSYSEIYRYTVATGAEVVTGPGLVTAVNTGAEELTVTDPNVSLLLDTYWRVKILLVP